MMASFERLESDARLPLEGVRLGVTPGPTSFDIRWESGHDRRVEVMIGDPFEIRSGDQTWAITADIATAGPFADLDGQLIAGAVALADGELVIRFENGRVLAIQPTHAEGWRVTVNDMTWVPQPGRGLGRWAAGLAESAPAGLAGAYLEYYRSGQDDARFDAWMQVEDLVGTAPDEALGIVVEMVAQARTEAELFFVAAGPLEDLVRMHGPVLIDRIEAEGRKDPKFRRALAGLWFGSEQTPTRARVERLLESA